MEGVVGRRVEGRFRGGLTSVLRQQQRGVGGLLRLALCLASCSFCRGFPGLAGPVVQRALSPARELELGNLDSLLLLVLPALAVLVAPSVPVTAVSVIPIMMPAGRLPVAVPAAVVVVVVVAAGALARPLVVPARAVMAVLRRVRSTSVVSVPIPIPVISAVVGGHS